ncbi:MAG TPA: putative ABC exporter domain-containing protein [Gemmatimonadaceae bacterium]
MNAFLYLVLTSGRNRLRVIARRVRAPRYAAALVVGILYLWAFLVRPLHSGGDVPVMLGKPTEMIVTLLAVITLMGSWLFGSDATALAFTQAEVSLLFPAPLTRRALIGYKLFRAQIAVLINALIWVFVLRRGGSALHPMLRAISLWVLFSTLNLHRLGAALVRSSLREHGAPGVRRNRWSTIAFGVLGLALLVGLSNHREQLTAGQGIGHFFTALGAALAAPPASWALYPFHLVVAPTFAQTAAAWVHLIGPAVVVLAAHMWWVFRADTAFEDAAIQASADRARRLEEMRSRRTLAIPKPVRGVKSTIALASVGHPAVAVFWKNILCLRRTAQLRLFIGPLTMAVVLGAALTADRDAGNDVAAIIATSALSLAAMLLVFGGRLIRNDMRQDMQHLPFLKALPVAPGELMIAEVASSALPMAAVQVSLIVIAYISAALTNFSLIDANIRLGVLIAAPIAAVALNAALMTIQNGTAVLFPGWIRLGPAVSTGVEALGQNVLATVANLVSLVLALVLPGLAGFLVIGAFGGMRVSSLVVAIIVGSIILAIETYGALRLLGRVFARAEPLATA